MQVTSSTLLVQCSHCSLYAKQCILLSVFVGIAAVKTTVQRDIHGLSADSSWQSAHCQKAVTTTSSPRRTHDEEETVAVCGRIQFFVQDVGYFCVICLTFIGLLHYCCFCINWRFYCLYVLSS